MRRILVIMAAFALVACAPKKQPEDVSLSPSVTLEVTNSTTPPVQVTVFIKSATGGRRTLGTVSPSRTERFTYAPTNASETFNFIAQVPGGRTLTSQGFTLVNVQTATWDMQSNLVRFMERQP